MNTNHLFDTGYDDARCGVVSRLLDGDPEYDRGWARGSEDVALSYLMEN